MSFQNFYLCPQRQSITYSWLFTFGWVTCPPQPEVQTCWRHGWRTASFQWHSGGKLLVHLPHWACWQSHLKGPEKGVLGNCDVDQKTQTSFVLGFHPWLVCKLRAVSKAKLSFIPLYRFKTKTFGALRNIFTIFIKPETLTAEPLGLLNSVILRIRTELWVKVTSYFIWVRETASVKLHECISILKKKKKRPLGAWFLICTKGWRIILPIYKSPTLKQPSWNICKLLVHFYK